MRRLSLLCILLFKLGFSQTLEVLLSSLKTPKQVTLEVLAGEYDLVLQDGHNLAFALGEKIQLNFIKNKIQIVKNKSILAVLEKFELEENAEDALLSIRSTEPALPLKVYRGSFHVLAKHGSGIQFVNYLDELDYLEGVVQAESGFGKHVEFYKAQAIISRTYLYRNFYKHQKDKANVCDEVHCQVYKGVLAESPDIVRGVHWTANQILVDDNKKPIDALFFSNSGGETVSSEDYWTEKIPYLRAVKDEFSVNQPSYTWQKSIPRSDFYKYIRQKFHAHLSDAELDTKLKHQFDNRKIYLGDSSLKIPLKTIRWDWALRSTFFVVEKQGETLLFKGKGYGHGVGLSQEGAMNMATQGYDFMRILSHYYQNTHLTTKSEMDSLYYKRSL
jgi:stage II sporulation protein D